MKPAFTRSKYDVIVIGARCAGAATAMLLARAGLRVLCVDRKPLGSDTISTHALMRPAVVQLARWGVLDRLIANGTPLIRKTTFHYGATELSFELRPENGIEGLVAPRRTWLDSMLVAEARRSGAEVAHDVSVTDVHIDAGGRVRGAFLRSAEGQAYVQAAMIVGADGIGSMLARAINAPLRAVSASSSSHVYAYTSLPENDGYHWYFNTDAAASIIPTNDEEACVVASVPTHRYDQLLGSDHAKGWCNILGEVSPELAGYAARNRVTGFKAFKGRPGYLRRAYGAGWALVGDAGFFRDPITSHGISDALRDAELLSRAIVEGSEVAMTRFQSERDELALKLLHGTDAIASFKWTLGELETLHRELGRVIKREAETLAGLDDFDVSVGSSAAA